MIHDIRAIPLTAQSPRNHEIHQREVLNVPRFPIEFRVSMSGLSR